MAFILEHPQQSVGGSETAFMDRILLQGKIGTIDEVKNQHFTKQIVFLPKRDGLKVQDVIFQNWSISIAIPPTALAPILLLAL